MKSFLLKSDKTPLIRFSQLPNNTYFEGQVPSGMHLAVAPSKNNKNGYEHIPHLIKMELDKTFNYKTGSGGAHHFIKYTGNKTLMNRATSLGLDLRIGARNGNNGGYVRYQNNKEIRECVYLIKESSEHLNNWLEKLFS